MELKFEKTVEDVRGKVFFYSSGDNLFGFSQTKKGFARGGHYRDVSVFLFFMSGKAKYYEKNLASPIEKSKIVTAPCIVEIPPNTANLLIALDEVLLVERLPKNNHAKTYPEYRRLVEDKMKKTIR